MHYVGQLKNPPSPQRPSVLGRFMRWLRESPARCCGICGEERPEHLPECPNYRGRTASVSSADGWVDRYRRMQQQHDRRLDTIDRIPNVTDRMREQLREIEETRFEQGLRELFEEPSDEVAASSDGSVAAFPTSTLPAELSNQVLMTEEDEPPDDEPEMEDELGRDDDDPWGFQEYDKLYDEVGGVIDGIFDPIVEGLDALTRSISGDSGNGNGDV